MVNREGRKKVKIICSSPSGLAECSYISGEIKRILKEENIDSEILECKVSDIDLHFKDYDLVISTKQLPPKINKPKISGIPFLTGNKIDEARKELLKLLGY